MKHIVRTALCLLLVCTALLTSCSRVPTMKYKDGMFTNPRTRITYQQAPAYYEAVARSSDSVAKIDGEKVDDLLLYPISGMDRSQWLCGEDYSVFYAEGITLPALWEMGTNSVLICKTDEQTASLAEIGSLIAIERLVDTYRKGVWFDYAEMDGTEEMVRYDLKFVSSTYKGLQYDLTYWSMDEDAKIYVPIQNESGFEVLYPGVEVTTETYEYTDKNGESKTELLAVYNFGKHLLYDRWTGRCYPIDDVIEKALQNGAVL